PGPRVGLILPDCEISAVEPDLGHSFYDLTLCAWPRGTGFEAELIYARELYSDESIAAFGAQFLRLLDSGLEDPAIPVEALPFLSKNERHRLLDEWSGRGGINSVSSALPFLDHFAGAVERHAEREAIRFGAESISYHALNAWSDRIAHGLAARGVGRETLVG